MLNLLNAIAAGSAVFLAFLVATVRRDANATANRWLGIFLLLVGLLILDDSLLAYGVYNDHPKLIGLFTLTIFALAPLLYLTVSQFVAVERRFRHRDLWHFLPFGSFLLLSLPFLFSSDEVKLRELKVIEAPLDLPGKVILSLMMFQIVVYQFFSFRKLRRFRNRLDNITASPTSVSLSWLRYFLWSVLGMTVTWFIELFLLPTPTTQAGWYSLAYLAGIYILGYVALRQKEVYPYSGKDAEAVGAIMEEAETAPITRKPLFSNEKLDLLKAYLLQKMETDKPYLEPELNLPMFARQMGLSVHEMSELINKGFGENFAQFVNRYRVEESKRLLLSEKHAHLNMVGIAFEAGFNSKTAFNTVFKKMTGVSPTAFRGKLSQ